VPRESEYHLSLACLDRLATCKTGVNFIPELDVFLFIFQEYTQNKKSDPKAAIFVSGLKIYAGKA
jgi:hypothetical protein